MNNNFKGRAFAILFGQAISVLTSSVMQMAIVWHLTLSTGSAVTLTIATLSGYMPQAFLGSFVGPIIDRNSKKKILIFSDLAIGIISLALAMLAFADNMPITAILVVLALRSVCNSFHEPATQALTPLIVPEDYILKYAGYSQAFLYVSQLLSPGVAIIMYNYFHLGTIMAFDTIGAVFAVAILLLLKLPQEVFPEKIGEKPNMKREFKEGLDVLKNQKGAIPLIIVGALYCAIYSPIGSLYPHLSITYFGATTTQSGLVEMFLSVGALIGSFILGRFAEKIPKVGGIAGSIFIYGVIAFSIGLLPPNGYAVFFVLSFVLGLSIPFFYGINRAVFQLAIPQEYLGRAFAVVHSTRRFGMPVGLIFGSVFADSTGINYMFIIGGALAMVLGLVVLRIPSMREFKKL